MKKLTIISLILATMTLVAYQNCAKPVSFSSPSTSEVDSGNPDDPSDPTDPTDPTDPGGPTDPDEPDIIPSCAVSSALKTKIIDVAFNSIDDCKWNNSSLGNLGKVNGKIQARHEEPVDLAIPAGAVLCDMELDFPEQSFIYDDHVVLALNNRILMNTGSDMHQYLQSDGSGYIYDWSKLVGKSQDVGGTRLYCNGNSTCNVPSTEQTGKILIDIPKSTIQKIVTMSPQSVNQIKMITTGDDDANDCNHTPISFKVKATYHD